LLNFVNLLNLSETTPLERKVFHGRRYIGHHVLKTALLLLPKSQDVEMFHHCSLLSMFKQHRINWDFFRRFVESVGQHYGVSLD